MVGEIKEDLESHPQRGFIVKYAKWSGEMSGPEMHASNVTKPFRDHPILVILSMPKTIRVRAVVPEALASPDFNAKTWIRVVGVPLNQVGKGPKGKDVEKEANFTVKKKLLNMEDETLAEMLAAAEESAREFAEQHLDKAKSDHHKVEH